jgi:hypothetical protein
MRPAPAGVVAPWFTVAATSSHRERSQHRQLTDMGNLWQGLTV